MYNGDDPNNIRKELKILIQSYNDNKSIVRDYTDSANVKDYVQNVLVPRFFPRIPVSELKVGEIGLISEYLSDMVEDGSYGTTMALNETFITKAVIDESIYSAAATFDLGYNYAVPAACPIVLEINYDDILQYAVDRQVYIDRDTKIIINGYEFVLDYDIRLTYTYIGGRIRFNAVYDMKTFNPVSKVNSQYIPCRVSDHWVLLYITVRECRRIYKPEQITDNMLFTAGNISLPFSQMICGMSAYYTYNKETTLMTNKVKYSLPLRSPFLYHRLKDENTIEVSFASGKNAWRPAFNSQIDFTLYTTNGDAANFYIISDMECTVIRTGERYIYNEDLRAVAIPYNAALGGNDQPSIEMVRWDTIEAFNTAHILMTDDDISLYFENYSRRYNTVAKFFKRRDDPTGRLFGMFNIINKDAYIYETLTAKARIALGPGKDIDTPEIDGVRKICDTGTYSNNYMTTTIYSGDLWQYVNDLSEIDNHTILRMTKSNIGTEKTPPANPETVFVNPFIIKINKYPGLVSYYNPLINYNGIMKQDQYEEAVLDHFIVTYIEMYRGIGENQYRVRVKLVPSTQESTYNEFDVNRNFKYSYFSDAKNVYRFSFNAAKINKVGSPNSTGNVNQNNGQQELLPDGQPNPDYLKSITEYVQDTYGIFPANGCTVYDTDILTPDEHGFEGKYVYNTFRDFIPVTPSLFPLRVVLSAETTIETNYTEMTCIADEEGTYTFECSIQTENDVRVVQGHEVLSILTGGNPYDTKNIPGTTPTADIGTTFVFTSDTKMHVYTLFKTPMQSGVVIDPSKDKRIYFSNASGTPPIINGQVWDDSGNDTTARILDARFNAIVKHLQYVDDSYTDNPISTLFGIKDTDLGSTKVYRYVGAPTHDWQSDASFTPNDGFCFAFSFSHPPSIYNNDPILFSNNISAAYLSMPNLNGKYPDKIPDKSTVINGNDGTTYQYIAESDRWLLFGSPSLFSDSTFRGWNITDSFINDYNDFDLLEQWTQMRSACIFNGNNANGYTVDVGLVPFLRYDVCTDPEKVSFVIRTMVAQYKAMAQLVSDRLEENTGIDFKLFNTCGRGVFYKIGVDNPDISIWQRMDMISIRIKFMLGVHEEVLYQDTMDAVKDHIKAYIETLNIDEATIFNVSNLQTSVENTVSNVRYMIFLGINDYPATYQRIRLDDPYKVDMSTYEMQIYVPEKLTINRNNIIIIRGDH